MSQWLVKGLRRGIRTTTYPAAPEQAAGVTPGLPCNVEYGGDPTELARRCPTGAIGATGHAVAIQPGRCIHCYRCVRGTIAPLTWESGYEWAETGDDTAVLDAPFRRSVNVLVVDAGDCGACLNEVKQLNNPYYNMHRLGFFITPSPRHADVILIVGPVTDHMRGAVEKIYAATPTPKRVVAVGACAISGGVFAGSFACANGVTSVLPVDVEVPGNPPPPLAILHGLLVATGRSSPAPKPRSR
jgi:Ni,Fe-hydrogenase III small subunit